MSTEPEPTPASSAEPSSPATGAASGAATPPTSAETVAPALLAEALRDAQQEARELAAVARRNTEIADELHAENRRLREGEVREATAPLVRGLARLADEIAVITSSAAGADPTAADLTHIEQRVIELLHDAGVTPLKPAPGDAFNVQVHTAAGSVPTENPLEDQTVVGVRKPGLIRDDGRLVRPAEVLVYRFDTRSSATPDPKRTTE